MGLPIDMRTLITCWDSASVFIVKDREDTKPDYKPYDTRFDVRLCPASEAWKEADFDRWGHVYCDEFHQACASSYHPDGHVVIPQNLMKGDDHCHFQWVMPPDARKLELGAPTELGRRLARDYQALSDVEGAWQALKRTNRLVGGRFVTAARVLEQAFGEDGRDTIARAMRMWGSMRGTLLRGEHEARGLARTPENFLRHHDLPFATVWDAEARDAGAGTLVAQVRETPHDEAWRDMQADDLGELWYGSYVPMMAAYLPGAHLEWTRLKCRGDEVNELRIRPPG
jgi:L-2-amino-thiazoline-4-carboxylic acid hydrolase